jgi:molybdate transport system regulatory protein
MVTIAAHPVTSFSQKGKQDKKIQRVRIAQGICMLDIWSLIDSASNSELKLILANVESRLAEQGTVTPVRHPGSASLSVPEGTKHLTSEELDLATDAFGAWCSSAKTPMQSRSRNRLWVAFLLIRYGALRLGEVLTLDDRKDLAPARNQVIIRSGHPREVLLPEPVMSRIDRLLASPMLFNLRGQVLHLDQGYLRRKFYERAKSCNLPGSLFNPRVIRHSRAIELLRGGVPLQVVQSYLGQQSLTMAANYLEFSGESVQRIVKQYIRREGKMKTSARNAFTGTVSKIVKDALLVEVEVTTLSGLKVVAVITDESFQNLRLGEGSAVTATVKAPWVILTEPRAGLKSSAGNMYEGIIARVKESEIACEVLVDLHEGSKVCALLTRESVKNLDLKPGKDTLVLFKSFSVILNVE